MSGLVEEQARKAADDFRRTHGLGTLPLGDLVALVEHTTGHDVAVLDTEADEHGLTMRDPVRGRAFVGVSRSRNPMRQRSSIAHELAHLVFEDHAQDLTRRSPEEVRADAFARHLLIPQEGLTAWLGHRDSVTEATLSDVVQRFLVSPAIAAIAMREAGYIGADLALAWMKITTRSLATRFGWIDYYAGLQAESDRVRAPQALLARAVLGYSAGVVSAQAVATLRGVSTDALLAEFAEAGVVPNPPGCDEFEADHLPRLNVDLSGLDDSTCTP